MSKNKPALIAGIWFILGLIYSSQSFFYYLSIEKDFLWQKSLFHSFLFCAEWALLTIPVLKLADVFHLDSKSFVRNIVFHFIIGVSVALVQQTIFVTVVDFVESGFVFTHAPKEYIPSIVGFFEYGVLMYWSIVFVSHATKYYRDYQSEQQHATELRSQLVESQLQSLKMQLQPHFLFNTLNAIYVLVKKEPALAQKMISRLSDLLRLILEQRQTNEVPLRQELEFLNTYLAIEKVRFGDRLKISFSIDEKSIDAMVPTFVLQPLAENSIRHGIAQRAGVGWIEIQSEIKNGKLIIEVIDGSKKVRRVTKETIGMGVGLENVQKRLEKVYGTKQSFHYLENDSNGVTIRMEIPFVTYIQN